MGYNNDILTDLKQRLLSWIEKLQSWYAIQIPRWCKLNSSTDAELYVYLEIHLNLLMVRYGNSDTTKETIPDALLLSVNPIKPQPRKKSLTVPKLELQTVVMACKIKSVTIDKVKFVHFRGDSKTVINYLKTK